MTTVRAPVAVVEGRTADAERVTVVPDARTPAAVDTLVTKFGGTSIATPERISAVAHRLAMARREGNRVVAVLSAMGDTTDRLLDLARRLAPRPDRRELDVLVSVGESISCALAAMVLHGLGEEAISLSGQQAGIVTDAAYGKAKIVEIRAQRIHEELDRGRIVLIAGFQGVAPDADVRTLGRGGSDTTAVALAVALRSGTCEIYTDVNGVYTADPRLVPEARKLDAVTYDEMLELSTSGAGVLQARSVELARTYGVKVHVRSAFHDAEGTWIVEEDERMLEKAVVSGVTYTREEGLYEVDAVTPATLFAALAEAGANVDTIVRNGAEVVFSAPHSDHDDVVAALDAVGASWDMRDDLGRVTVVGAGFKSHPGVAATAFAALDEIDVEPELVTTSPIKIACHVPSGEVERAVRQLHRAFGLDAPEAQRVDR
jgi:aspartate kinase